MKPFCVVSLIWLCVGCVGFAFKPTGAGDGDDAGGAPPPLGGSSGSGGAPIDIGGSGGSIPTGGHGGSAGGSGGSTGTGGGGGTGGSTPARFDAGSERPGADGGTAPADGGTTAPPDGPIQIVCTSNKRYSGGNGPTMRPGDQCPRCHGFAIAGTVYPTLHEPNNCNGVNGSSMTMNVVITDANGGIHTINVNSVGNFYFRGNIPKPFKAKVIVGGRERSMLLPQTNGACNACHTPTGANLAPGRIMAPAADAPTAP